MKVSIAAALVAAFSLAAHAAVSLPHVLSDHAVLQRNRPIHIWGWSLPVEAVSVSFHNQKLATTADKLGEWHLWLDSEQAGGPYTLTVSSDKTPKPIERTDILVGDVWIASGQSNMEFPMSGWPNQPLKDGAAELAEAQNSQIRLIHADKTLSAYPLSDIANNWELCTPDTVKSFSAVAYFFGKELLQQEQVPIGLIQAAWGGTPAHSFISAAGLADANLDSVYRDSAQIASDIARGHAMQDLWKRQDDEAKRTGATPLKHPSQAADSTGPFTPSTLFNSMIAPFTPFTIRGAIWYQGETDRDPQRAPYYHRVFPALINDWRKQWHQPDLPFLYVQISSFPAKTGDWGAVREAQRQTLSLRNTAMAVTLDVGSKTTIHPPDKQAVAHRLAIAARSITYNETLAWQSASVISANTEGSAMRVYLTNAEGLTSSATPLTDFEVAGPDRVFHPATATIEQHVGQTTLLVSSPDVPNPISVRYGWAPFVSTYLHNGDGFPLGTFVAP